METQRLASWIVRRASRHLGIDRGNAVALPTLIDEPLTSGLLSPCSSPALVARMKCRRCQHDNPQGARFCEECATPLARTCSSCGTALSATAKFCHACAHPVPAAAGAPSRAPDSYTP